MNTKELNRLLKKYYNGESTEEEEMTLRVFFQGDSIPDGYKAEKEIFGYYSEAAVIPEPSPDFEKRILAGIDKVDNNSRKNMIRRYILPSLSTAAGLLILIGSYYFFVNKNGPKDTFSDPQIAYAETMKILMEVSMKLNQGTQALEPIGKIDAATAKSFKAINRSAKVMKKNLQSLDYLQTAFEITKVYENNDK